MFALKLSVVIVNYNVKYYLWQCLHSVFVAGQGIDMEVFVVDNNSTDGSVPFLRRHFPQVHYIENKENVGFSRANNQAIRLSKGEYVLLLNPDTLVLSNTFRDCIHWLDDTPEAGAVGVAMYGADGRFALESRRGLPVPWTSLCKMTGLTKLFPKSRLFGRYYMQFLDETQISRIEVISGAFNMLRRTALDEVGLLDEDFFMYGEDVDLSYRLLKGGWHNYYVPTPILHYKGESTQRSSYRYVYIFYDAMLIFINKHFRQRYRFFTYLIQLAVHLRALMDYFKRFVMRLKLRFAPEPPVEKQIDMADFCLYDITPSDDNQSCFDRLIQDTIQRCEKGDQRPLGIRYSEQNLLVLPCAVLEGTAK